MEDQNVIARNCYIMIIFLKISSNITSAINIE